MGEAHWISIPLPHFIEGDTGVPHPSGLRVRVLVFLRCEILSSGTADKAILHFVTFSCYRRRPLLGTVRARDRFVKILDEVRRRHAFRLVGYAVMPEHVHLLMSEPAKKNLSKILQVLKQKVARALLRKQKASTSAQLSLPFDGGETEGAHFWQRRFYDFNVWSEKS
jgi:REP element-mobilizing transposase RayT